MAYFVWEENGEQWVGPSPGGCGNGFATLSECAKAIEEHINDDCGDPDDYEFHTLKTEEAELTIEVGKVTASYASNSSKRCK